jgi:hypothetical protein
MCFWSGLQLNLLVVLLCLLCCRSWEHVLLSPLLWLPSTWLRHGSISSAGIAGQEGSVNHLAYHRIRALTLKVGFAVAAGPGSHARVMLCIKRLPTFVSHMSHCKQGHHVSARLYNCTWPHPAAVLVPCDSPFSIVCYYPHGSLGSIGCYNLHVVAPCS